MRSAICSGPPTASPPPASERLISRLDDQKRHVLTPYGRRVALFLTKVHARVLRPGFQALDLTVIAQAPPSCAPRLPRSITPSMPTSGRLSIAA
jgi:hypothetical protein